jgi:hypothetical protein
MTEPGLAIRRTRCRNADVARRRSRLQAVLQRLSQNPPKAEDLRALLLDGNRMRFALVLFAFACSSFALAGEEQATSLPTPASAVDVRHQSFNDGHASQTDFKLTAKFPANPALTHYAATLDKSWASCAWMEDWNHFLDGTKNPAVTIHQTGHIWLKSQAKRFIMLSVRYISSDKSAVERPETDEQHVVIVEYMDVDTIEVANHLGLSCAKE